MFTLLKAWGRRNNTRFSKQFGMDNSGNYVELQSVPKVSRFVLEDEVYPESLDEMFDFVESLMGRQDVAVIRERYIGDSPSSLRRVSEAFSPLVESNIVCLDIDNLESSVNSCNMYKVGEHIASILHDLRPDIFPKDLGYIVQGSASAGIKSGIRAHMFLESNIALNPIQLGQLFASLNNEYREKMGTKKALIDTSLYHRVHILYFASPTFQRCKDPFVVENLPRLIKRKGAKMTPPDYYRDIEKTYNRSRVTDKEFELYGKINFQKTPSPILERELENLPEQSDEWYTRHILRIYHKALAEGYSFDALDRAILPHIERYVMDNDKQKVPADYVNNARKAAVHAWVSNAKREISMPGVNVIVPNSKGNYLDIKELPAKHKLTFIKASLGSGKTHTVAQWLKSPELVGKRCVAITNTVSLVEANALKLGMESYSDGGADAYASGDVERLSITIHSTHRLLGCGCDFLFLDEADAILNDLLKSSLTEARRPQILRAFAELINSATYVVLADGDLSEETIKLYSQIIEDEKDIDLILHDRKMLDGVRAVEVPTSKAVWTWFFESLVAGQKSLMVTTEGPSTINAYLEVICEQFSGVVRAIHSDSSLEKVNRKILQYTNKELLKQKVAGLICSPSVTNGVDFRYFDNVFSVTDTPIHTPYVRFQAIRRDRGAKFICYYVAPQCSSPYIDGVTLKDIFSGIGEILTGSKEIMEARYLRESQAYAGTLRYLLADQGAEIDILSKADIADWDIIKPNRAAEKIKHAEAIMASQAQGIIPMYQNAFEEKQKCAMYLEKTVEEIEMEDAVWYVKNRPEERAIMLMQSASYIIPLIKKARAAKDKIGALRQYISSNKKGFYHAFGFHYKASRLSHVLYSIGIGYNLEYDHVVEWVKIYCAKEGIGIPRTLLNIHTHGEEVTEI